MTTDFELNHLKYFYYTVLEGGVVPAALRLHVQQPVVSKMVKTLEENLGQPLFYKKGRNKQLTDYGQLVFRHAQNVFEEIDKIKMVSDKTSNIAGVLNIGGAEPMINHYFPKRLADFHKTFPSVHLNVYTSTQAHLMQLISEGHLNVGLFFYAPHIPKELEVIERIPFLFRLIVSKKHKDDPEVLETFIGSREIEDTSTHRFPTVDLLKTKRPNTRIRFSSNSITLHKELVLLGQGVSILPEFLVEKELKSGRVVDVLPKKKFQFDLKVIARKSEPPSVLTREFLNLLTK